MYQTAHCLADETIGCPLRDPNAVVLQGASTTLTLGQLQIYEPNLYQQMVRVREASEQGFSGAEQQLWRRRASARRERGGRIGRE